MPRSKERPKSAKRRTIPNPPASTDIPVFRTFTIILAAWLILRLIATSFISTTVLWGLDIGGYLTDRWDIWAALLAPFLLLLPPIQGAFARLFHRIPDRPLSPLWQIMVTLGLTTLGVVVSMALRPLWPLLGDGANYLAEVFHLYHDPGYQSNLIRPTSFLTGHLIAAVVGTMKAMPDNREPFEIVARMGAGVLCLGAMLLLIRERFRAAISVVGILFLSTGSLLFLGYVELYAMQYAFAVLFLLAAWQSFTRNTTVIIPVALLVISILFGGSSIIFLPALAFLLYMRYGTRLGVRPVTVMLLLLGGTVLAVIVGYLIIGFSTRNLYLTTFGSYDRDMNEMLTRPITYTVLAPIHLNDIVQVLLLVGGPALTVLALLVHDKVRRLLTEPFLLFLIIASFAGLCLVVFGNAALGLARDWDLTITAISPIILLCIVLILRLSSSGILPWSRVFPMLAIATASMLYIWVQVNMSEASLTRFERMVERYAMSVNPRFTFNGYESLRKFYERTKRMDECFRVLDCMASTRINQLDTYAQIFTLYNGYHGDAIVVQRLFDRMVSNARDPLPESDTRHENPQKERQLCTAILNFALDQKKISRDDPRFDSLKKYFGGWPELRMIDACLDQSLTPAQRATIAKEALSPSILHGLIGLQLADLHLFADQPLEAQRIFEHVIELDKNSYIMAYIGLADIHQRIHNDIPKAIAILEAGERNCRFSSKRKDLLDMLTALRAQLTK